MNLRNNCTRFIVGVLAVFSVVSCDDDPNAVGGEVLGDVNFSDETYQSVPVAYSKKLARVQTSAIPSTNDGASTANIIGYYDDPVYGLSKYSVLSQVRFNNADNVSFVPSFGTNPVLDSVVLSIPYYSRELTSVTDADGLVRKTYALDSVYGSTPMNISVYRSNYFLRDVDPSIAGAELEQRQVYYSDDINNFGASVEDDLLATAENVLPSSQQIVLILPDGADEDSDQDVVFQVPQLKVKLPNDYFATAILDKNGTTELSNINNFRNYFRGIYLKPELVGAEGNLFFFNKNGVNITLYYTFENADGSGDRSSGSVQIAFDNNSVNGIDSTLDPTIATTLENQDSINGEKNLYLKGGDGSYAVLDLFGGTVSNENGEQEAELSFLQRQDWLVNEANLIFYIDQEKVISGDSEPERIYIFDEETGLILVDFSLDNVSTTSPINSIPNHLGRISRGSDNRGEFYKIKITRHIVNVLNGSINNNRLGVAVSQNVNIFGAAKAFTPNSTEDDIVPFASVLSHEGTILYGNTDDVPESKRLRLEIFYSKSEK